MYLTIFKLVCSATLTVPVLGSLYNFASFCSKQYSICFNLKAKLNTINTIMLCCNSDKA